MTFVEPDGRWPIALLPVRLETRYRMADEPGPAGNPVELLIRVFPDDVHAQSHESLLTRDEVAWGANYWTRGGNQPNSDADRQAWAQLADRYGPRRAAWIAQETAARAPDAETKAGSWTEAARAAALPDCWVAFAYRHGQRIASVIGRPIPPLSLGPNPGVAGPDPGPAGEPHRRIDPGMLWMTDFTEAEEKGMGLRLPVVPLMRPHVSPNDVLVAGGVDRLVVLGVRSSADPVRGAEILADLFQSHHFTRGLGLIPVGTPTNNTSSTDRAGWAMTAPSGHAHSYRVERGEPLCVAGDGHDGSVLARALGLDASVFEHLEHADGVQEVDARAMNTALHPVTWGYLLGRLVTPPVDDATMRTFFIDCVRAAGPLPALRVGNQPYGVLPCITRTALDPGPDAALLRFLSAIEHILSYYLNDPTRLPADDLTIERLLEHSPVSLTILARAMFGTQWQANAVTFMGQDNQVLIRQVERERQRNRLVWSQQLGDAPAGHRPVDMFTAGSTGRLRIPLVQAEPLADATLEPNYLKDLADAPPGDPAEVPDALLALLVRQGLRLMRGGLVGGAEAEFRAALQHLRTRPAQVLDRLLRETLDVAGHRLDPWVTGLATQRLAQTRSEHPTGVLVGGWGVIEDLGEPVQRRSDGYLHAPSIGQAAAAAVLRCGYLTHNGDASAAIDLSSDRVRTATYVLDGIRQGQSLAALLGYRLERALHDAHLDGCIAAFRRLAPLDGRSTALVDGHKIVTGWPDPATLPFEMLLADQPADPATSRARLIGVVTDLVATADAVSDAVLAESVYQAVQGNWVRVGATLEGAAGGDTAPPELEFTGIPRTGIGCTHRVILPLDATARPPAGPGWTTTPRAEAEPALDRWIAGLVGSPARIVCLVEVRDADETVIPNAVGSGLHRVTMDQLDVSPIDLVRLAADHSEIEARLAVQLGRSIPSVATACLGEGDLGDDDVSLAVALEIARAVGELAAKARPLDARDLALPGDVAEPGVDLAVLAARADDAAAMLAAVVAEIDRCLPAVAVGPGVPAKAKVDEVIALRSALESASDFGVRAAVPEPVSEPILMIDDRTVAALVSQAVSVQAEIKLRLIAAAARDPHATPPASMAAAIKHECDRIQTVFGAPFPVLPPFAHHQQDDLGAAFARTDCDTDEPGQGPLAWFTRLARVRPPLSALEAVTQYGQALGTAGPLGLRIGQLPLDRGRQRWAGLPLEPSTNLPGGRMAIVSVADLPATGPVVGLFIDEILEVVPSAVQTTGIAFHYDGPGAQAPQAVLLAVPPRPGLDHWNLDTLEATVLETLELSRVRSLTPMLLQSPHPWPTSEPDPNPDPDEPPPEPALPGRSPFLEFDPILPGVFLPNDVDDTPGAAIQRLTPTPANFGQYEEHCQLRIDRIDVIDGSPTRGHAVTIMVTGCGFNPPGDQSLNIRFDGISVSTVVVRPPDGPEPAGDWYSDTSMRLTVTIAPAVPLGVQHLHLRGVMGTVRHPAFDVVA